MYLNAKTTLDALKKVTENLEVEISQLQSKVDETIPKPKKYIPYPKTDSYKIYDNITLGNSSSYFFLFKNYWGTINDKDITVDMLEERWKHIQLVAAKYEADCNIVSKANLEIITHNNIVRDKITSIMKELGVPDTYYTKEYKTNRSTKLTETKHYAGYKGDLDRLMPAEKKPLDVVNMLSGVKRTYDEKLRTARDNIHKAEMEKIKVTQMHELALLRAKYTPDNPISDVHTIRDVILSKDKYLMLGYWLMRNREDWSDGYGYAEVGLSQFSIDSVEDAEIHASLTDIIRNGYDEGSVDGRVFRDCEYSYGYLFGKVSDQSLFKDYEKITSMMGSF